MARRSVMTLFSAPTDPWSHRTRLVLAERRRWQNALPIGLERAEIVFEARNQRHMPHGTGSRRDGQQVAHHGGIDLDILCFGRLTHPGGKEDVGGAQSVQRGPQASRIEQIGGNGLNAFDIA